MDKFEDIVKQAVEGYEVPFNMRAWDNVSNELGDSFDQMMKDSTNGFEAPYDPAAWEAVSAQLGPAYATWKWISGSAALLAIIAGASYFLHISDKTDEMAYDPSGQVTVLKENLAENAIDLTNIISENNTEDTSDNNLVTNELDEHRIIGPIGYDVRPDANQIDMDLRDGLAADYVIAIDRTTAHDGDDDSTSDDHNYTSSENTISTYKTAAEFVMSTAETCPGEACTFTPEDINNDLIYVWDFGDGSLSSSILGVHKFRRPGEFNITLEIKHPRTNKTIASSSKMILVNAPPIANFSWTQSSEVIPTVGFINLTNEAMKWAWDIKGLKQSNKNEFEYTFRKAGNYLVELTAENENGCKKLTQKTITIEKDYNLLAPTGFSPDGDFQNDNFIPEALKIMEADFTMTIMDKNGRQVYVTQNAFKPWDGRYTQDNTMAPSGSSYIWRVVLINNNGEQEFYEGQVFVVR